MSIFGRGDRWGTGLVYGFAHLGKSLFWYASELLFAYFLTELVGLSSPEMGTVLAIGLVASALLDIAAGFGLRHRLTDARSAGAMQYVGAVLCSITLLLVFADAWLPPVARFAYAMLSGLAFRLSYALYDIPQNALMALATANPESRGRLAATRILFSGIATLVVAGMVGPLVGQGGYGAQLLFGLAILFAATAIGGAALLWRQVARSAPATLQPLDGPRQDGTTPGGFWLLMGLMFATACFTPIFSKLEPYFAAYGLHSPFWGGGVVVAMAVGVFAGQPFWLSFCSRTSQAWTLACAAIVQLAGLLAFWLGGTGLPALSVGAALLFGIGNGGAGMVLWAAFSDIVAGMGAHRAGPSYALFTATAKLAGGGAILLVGVALARIDFRHDGIADLLAIMTVVPGFGAVLVLAAAGLLTARSNKAIPARPHRWRSRG